MSNITHSVPACRRCSHYQSEGRRGGHCGLLGAPVQGQWGACAVAQPLFELSIAPRISPKISEQAIALEEMITAIKIGTEALEPQSLEIYSASDPHLASELAATSDEIGALATVGAR